MYSLMKAGYTVGPSIVIFIIMVAVVVYVISKMLNKKKTN